MNERVVIGIVVGMITVVVVGIVFLILAGTTLLFGTAIHNWVNQPSDGPVCFPMYAGKGITTVMCT